MGVSKVDLLQTKYVAKKLHATLEKISSEFDVIKKKTEFSNVEVREKELAEQYLADAIRPSQPVVRELSFFQKLILKFTTFFTKK